MEHAVAGPDRVPECEMDRVVSRIQPEQAIVQPGLVAVALRARQVLAGSE